MYQNVLYYLDILTIQFVSVLVPSGVEIEGAVSHDGIDHAGAMQAAENETAIVSDSDVMGFGCPVGSVTGNSDEQNDQVTLL